jgi:coupling of ubiquitin conjugation to ER degradation protein 1
VGTGAKVAAAKPNLIQRLGLEDRVAETVDSDAEKAGGRATWEDTPEKREASLRERKAQMVLAARQCVLISS